MWTLLQQDPTPAEAAGILAAVLGILIVAMVVIFAINVVVCLLIYLPYKEVPNEHQKMAPGLVFLLLIPLFYIIWNFFVFLQIPESFQSYFASQGRTDVGDCGRTIGLWCAICGAAAMVPCVNYVAGPAALVLFIIFLVKIWGLKGMIGQAAMSPPGTPPVAG